MAISKYGDRLPQNPIFIVGFPRSGTTLLQALLATQPGIETCPETGFFFYLRELHIGVNDSIDCPRFEGLLSRLETRMEFQVPDRVKRELLIMAKQGELTPKILLESVIASFIGPSSYYVRYWLEKTPRHYFAIDQIMCLYPQAKIINVVRNPLYCVTSAKENIPSMRSRSIVRLSLEWLEAIRLVEFFMKIYPSSIITLRYEDLAEKPSETLAQLGSFLGISVQWERTIAREEVCKRIILPRETWKCDVSKPIYNRNNRNISMVDALTIQNVAGEKMVAYNYKLLFPWLQVLFNMLIRVLRNPLVRKIVRRSPLARWVRRIKIPEIQELARRGVWYLREVLQ